MSDDEDQYNPKAHKSLLQAISNIGRVQHIGKTTRSEPRPELNEFQLVKPTTKTLAVGKPKHRARGVAVNDIVQVLKKTKNHVATGKLLKNVRSTKKVLPTPLEKPVAARIKRTIGYEKVKKNLARWDAVVAKNRSSEQQIFPLPTETIYIDTSAHSKPLQKSVKSKLMLEMEAAEEQFRQLKRERIGDTSDEKQQEAKERALLQKKLTRAELFAKRKELAYLKMRESQKSAKARLKNKIKSKKYHKLLKRQKMQDQIKEFELLQKTNPEAALEKLNEIEKHRALERASLRHKNTGAWAKNLQVRAKYDKDVRKDLAEQLQISRQITAKTQLNESSDDETKENEEANKAERDTAATYDPFNPWTKGGDSKTNGEVPTTDDDLNWRKYWQTRNENEKMLKAYKAALEAENETEDEDEDKAESKEVKAEVNKAEVNKAEAALKENKVKKPKQKSAKTKAKVLTLKPKEPLIENGWKVEEINEESQTKTKAKPSKKKPKDIDDIFDEQEDIIKNKLQKKMQKLLKVGEKLKKQEKKRLAKLAEKKQNTKKGKNALKNLEDLSFKTTNKRPEIDEELNYEENQEPQDKIKLNNEAITKTEAVKGAIVSATESTNGSKDPQPEIIDPTKVATVKLKQNLVGHAMLNDAIADEFDLADDIEMGEQDQQMTISQAFEDDDIIADFSKDKAKDSEIKNAEIDLTMPGWGSWAGAGLSEAANKPRNNRLILKQPEEEKRRDDHKERVYINEETGKYLREHLVSDVPFPFTSLQDYEASIRAPIGRNYVTETAFRMLTRPAVITRKGQVIEPMDESELVKPPRKLRNTIDKRIALAEKQKQSRKPL